VSEDKNTIIFQTHNIIGGPGQYRSFNVNQVRLLPPKANIQGGKVIPIQAVGMSKYLVLDPDGKFLENNLIYSILKSGQLNDENKELPLQVLDSKEDRIQWKKQAYRASKNKR